MADERIRTWPTGAVITLITWHFHRNLYKRYKIILQPGEYTAICRKIKKGKLRPIHTRNNETGVFKYVHQGERKTTRIYIVAMLDGERLISVSKPRWVAQRQALSIKGVETIRKSQKRRKRSVKLFKALRN